MKDEPGMATYRTRQSCSFDADSRSHSCAEAHGKAPAWMAGNPAIGEDSFGNTIAYARILGRSKGTCLQ